MDRVADRLAQALAVSGVTHAFGMPGGEIVTFIDALTRAGIRFVLARNETAAAMMAAGTAVKGDRLGLLVTTLGPGLANAVNGIADAAQERNPLIVVSAVVDRGIRGRYTHQILDQAAMLRGVVKASFEVESEGVDALAYRAIGMALTMPYGPVHIDLSPEVAATAHQESHKLSAPSRRATPGASPDDPAIHELRARLAAAERPLIIAGLEAARCGAGPAIAALALSADIPVITTYKGKGIIDERLPQSLGAAGLSPRADALLLPLVAASDLVLLAGYDPIEMRAGWMDLPVDPDRLVEVSRMPADHGMHHAGLRVESDPGLVLGALGRAPSPRRYWPLREPSSVRTKLRSAFEPPTAWGPHAVFRALAEALPDTSIVTADSGAHRILLSQMWEARRPLELLQSAGWCTMGAAIPLAVGAALSNPAATVVAVLGDGGFEMTMGELGTLRDANVPLIILVLQDESLALIAMKQEQAGLSPKGVSLGLTDHVAIAAAFGGAGWAVNSSEQLRAALGAALTNKTFSLITCRIAASDYEGAF